MSDTPCVDGCGQDAATIERLRERLAEAEAAVARAEALADYWCNEEMPDPTTADIDLRAALAPQDVPTAAPSAPEAPGQPGRDEGGSGGRVGTVTVTPPPDVTDLRAALQRSIEDAKARRSGR